jgi:hypothetical protein
MTPHNLLLPIRQLTKRPGIAVAIVLVMAAGIGVNAAVFSVVYAVLLKPLPYPDPQQLVFISGTSGTGERIPISLPDFRDWRTQQSTCWFELTENQTHSCAQFGTRFTPSIRKFQYLKLKL